MTDRLRCAYVTSPYPSVTHTFVLREVQALRRRGVDVRTVSVRRARADEVLGDRARAEHASTFAIRPVGPVRFVGAHLRALRRTPYLRCLGEALRDAPGGPRALLWQVFYFAQAVLLWDWMRSNDLRHAHAHHANVSSDVAMIAARLGGEGWTWSFTLHGPTEFADPAAHKLAVKATRASAVVVISEYGRGELAREAPTANAHVVHCGIELPAYTHREPRTRSDGDPFRILNVAQMQPRKGQQDLLEAVARLDRPALLTVVGDGPSRAELSASASRLEVPVDFAGAVPEETVREHYAWADVFCLPSYSEGVPIVLMEAMASGVPVVATRIAGVPELVEHGVSGLLADAGDVAGLAEALRTIADDPALAARLAAEARRQVERSFDVDRSAEALEEVFRGVSHPRCR